MNKITEVTRREIIDLFETSKYDWSGRFTEDVFLGRIFDLNSMPSNDRRCRNAAADIYQHRINWQDWPDNWVFYDDRFNLLYCEDENFLRFLCETVHPAVRPKEEEAVKLVELYNDFLKKDEYEIFTKTKISEKPVFAARKLNERTVIFIEPTGWTKVDRQMEEVRQHLRKATTEEQYQAVGLLSREVLITLAQTVYNPEIHFAADGIKPSETDAARMLESYLAKELEGKINEETRSHAKAALKLAVALQHKRTADFRMAALCAEATASVVNIIAILSGRRDFK